MKSTVNLLGNISWVHSVKVPLLITAFVAVTGFMTGCASNAKLVKWFEETWNHEDGELRFIISGYNWTLLKNGVNDEKGTITFNEESKTFLMRSTHSWDKGTLNWEECSQKMTGSYSVSNNTWIVESHIWPDFNGKWYGASRK
jgi:hypothetical protein